MIYVARSNGDASAIGKVDINFGPITTFRPWSVSGPTYTNMKSVFVSPTKLYITGSSAVSVGDKNGLNKDWQYAATATTIGITIDTSGNIYYLDIGFPAGTALKKLNSAGALIGSYGANGAGVDELAGTAGQVIEYRGLLYIADGNNNRIVIRNSSTLGGVGSINVAGGTFFHAYCMIIDKSFIYVGGSDAGGNSGLKKYSLGGALLGSNISVAGAGDTQFNLSTGAGITTDGTYLYITDNGNNRLKKHLCSDLSYVSKLAWGITPYQISCDEWWNMMYGNISYSQSFAAGRGRPRRFVKTFNPADII